MKNPTENLAGVINESIWKSQCPSISLNVVKQMGSHPPGRKLRKILRNTALDWFISVIISLICTKLFNMAAVRKLRIYKMLICGLNYQWEWSHLSGRISVQNIKPIIKQEGLKGKLGCGAGGWGGCISREPFVKESREFICSWNICCHPDLIGNPSLKHPVAF